MDFQGYAFGVAAILLVAYVVPYLYRRRTVLSDARIEERYAEDLRMLEVPDSRRGNANGHAVGSHGTVFFRQPEVIMSQSDKARAKKAASAQAGSPSDVRALAKERARRRARISKRKANRQRGLLGASVAAIVGVILWVLVGVASLPVLVAGVGTGIGLVYLAGFGYVVNEMSQATAVDEEAIATIDRKLKASKGAAHLARSRRPVAPRVGNRPVNARPEAARARTARPETAAARADADQRAEESVKKLLGPQAEGEPKVSARWPKTAQSAVGGGQGGLSARSAERAGGAGSGSGLAMSLEPEIIESSDGIDVISAENSEERSSVLPAGSDAGLADGLAAGLADGLAAGFAGSTTAAAAVSSAPAPGNGAEAADGSEALVSGKQARTRKIERRVVTPYEAPPEPEAAVPYRPKEVGERLDEEPESNKAKDGSDGLTGGSALDALLDRRRA